MTDPEYHGRAHDPLTNGDIFVLIDVNYLRVGKKQVVGIRCHNSPKTSPRGGGRKTIFLGV